MKSVIENEYSMEIKNSKFISLIFPIHHKEEINIYLNQTKEKYPNATHYCYAYILEQEKYASDDGEPSGTAGIPILLVLEKQKLNHVLCIVVRYFGKIKLGAGGLVRAYTKSATEALKNHLVYLIKGYLVQITFSYSFQKRIDYLLKDKNILKKEFQEKVTYQLAMNENDVKELNSLDYLEIKILNQMYLPDLDSN